MTAQIEDVVVLAGRMYALLGVNGPGLFEPNEHGLQVHMTTAACRRGYVCEYAVDDERLFLTALRLGMVAPPTRLFGADLRMIGSAATYSALRVPLTLTGGLLLGAGRSHDLDVPMGRHPAWKYTEILELSFDDGGLVAMFDRSEVVGRRRDAPRDCDRWIETAFDRRYPPIL
ncbi:MAG: hypothetical protein JO082_01300 [Mycobacterium sp.]|nr:hypothetical protein [Mycobacterium sp.]